MSIDKSLKKPAGMVRARNVLKRGERIAVLREQDRWEEGRSPLNLPKVRIQKVVAGKKKKKKKADDEDEDE
ncbi:MAG TPA: small basic protein [Planctomycetaceae bacterium]|nr:small basic protein [Planctomycetaceae bacterium]